MRLNVLFSTTRQWNPGDEFILFGIQHLLNDILGGYNAIIYNRNPQIRSYHSRVSPLRTDAGMEKMSRLPRKLQNAIGTYFENGFYDNSFKYDTPSSIVDLAIFAGSPAWYGNNNKQMYEIIRECNAPALYLGIGCGECIALDDLSNACLEILGKSRLITCRDSYTAELLKDFGAVHLPCPALFSADKSLVRVRGDVDSVALIFSTNETLTGNDVNSDAAGFMRDYYLALIEKYPQIKFSLVCHYIDEISHAKEMFPELDIFYSYDAREYFDFYNEFDLVVGCRVHGIGACASMGIPGIMISHDKRSATTEGFLAKALRYDASTVEDGLRLFEECVKSNYTRSSDIVSHRKLARVQYDDLLKTALRASLSTNE